MQDHSEWKLPVQERSKRRFDAILDAAGAELDEVGWHRFTMESVALRAGGSIGSVYRYFPNKMSLIAALIDSQSEQLLRVFDSRDDGEKPFEDLVLEMIDQYGDAVRKSPGLPAVGIARAIRPRSTRNYCDTLLFRHGQWMAAALRRRLPRVETTRLEGIAAILVVAFESLLLFSNRLATPSRAVILRELRLVLRGYMNELSPRGHVACLPRTLALGST